jgi:MFS family permease
VAKRFSAARVIPLMMVGFGSCSLLSAAVTNFGGLFALRFLLGVFESPMWVKCSRNRHLTPHGQIDHMTYRGGRGYGMLLMTRLPSIVFYLSQFYTRGELARRIGIYYAASALSGVSIQKYPSI